MSTGRRAIRLAVTFLLGSVASKILVFALLPLYTRVLSPESYGFYDLSVTYVTIVASILFLDVWVGTMRFMYRAPNHTERGEAVKAGLVILGASTVLFVITGLTIGAIFGVPYLLLIIGYGVTTNLKEFFGFVARGYDMNTSYSVSGAVSTVVMVGLNLILLLVLHADLSALYVAAIVGNLVQVVWLEARARVIPTLWRYHTRWETIRSMLRFTLPLGINSVAYWLLTGIGKIVVFQLSSLTENGYYGIGTRIATLVVVLASVFTMVWQDISFTRGDRDAGAFYTRASSFYLAFVGFGSAVLVVLLGVAFPLIVGAEFAPLFAVLPGFILVAALGAYSTFLGNTFYALNTTHAVLVTTLTGAGLTLALSAPMVGAWGIAGANAAAALGFATIIVTRLVILRRRIGLRYPVLSTISSAVAASIATGAYLIDRWWLSALCLVALMAAFVLIFRNDLARLMRRQGTAN